jgi:hypothetical protein
VNRTFPPRDDYDDNVDSSHPEWSGNRGKVGGALDPIGVVVAEGVGLVRGDAGVDHLRQLLPGVRIGDRCRVRVGLLGQPLEAVVLVAESLPFRSIFDWRRPSA